MDVSSKVFSSVMKARAFQLMELHGVRFQYGGTPEIGCHNDLITLKALLNARRIHDLPLFIGFVDLEPTPLGPRDLVDATDSAE